MCHKSGETWGGRWPPPPRRFDLGFPFPTGLASVTATPIWQVITGVWRVENEVLLLGASGTGVIDIKTPSTGGASPFGGTGHFRVTLQLWFTAPATTNREIHFSCHDATGGYSPDLSIYTTPAYAANWANATIIAAADSHDFYYRVLPNQWNQITIEAAADGYHLTINGFAAPTLAIGTTHPSMANWFEIEETRYSNDTPDFWQVRQVNVTPLP